MINNPVENTFSPKHGLQIRSNNLQQINDSNNQQTKIQDNKFIYYAGNNFCAFK